MTEFLSRFVEARHVPQRHGGGPFLFQHVLHRGDGHVVRKGVLLRELRGPVGIDLQRIAPEDILRAQALGELRHVARGHDLATGDHVFMHARLRLRIMHDEMPPLRHRRAIARLDAGQPLCLAARQHLERAERRVRGFGFGEKIRAGDEQEKRSRKGQTHSRKFGADSSANALLSK